MKTLVFALLEGVGLGALLVLVCAFGVRHGWHGGNCGDTVGDHDDIYSLNLRR